jgi:predicted RNase H-like HicB family nuclease/large-conductance mechanosensitive channel
MIKYKMIIYWSDTDNAYLVEIPELAGCMADGATYQEAVRNAEQIINEWLETSKELGRHIPKPKGRFKNILNRIKTNKAVSFVILVAAIVFGIYFSKFHYGLSDDNGKWGTFGDYVGGMLNPIIAGFALYLIAESYKLQKKELEETRKLLKVSTDAQINQIKIAAITALLNSNLMCIDRANLDLDAIYKALDANKTSRNSSVEKDIKELNNTLKRLREENKDLEDKIKYFLKENLSK